MIISIKVKAVNVFEYKRGKTSTSQEVLTCHFSKMEVLKDTRQFGERIGLCMRENASRKEVAISFLVNFVFVFSLLLYLGGSLTLAINAYPDDLATISYCILEFTATVALLCPYIMSIQQKYNLMNMVNDIQKFVWQSKASFAFY